jgi:GNAT superfamily N-acetyltransferase
MSQNSTMNISYSVTTNDDADELVEIRILAMRESLERIGRFDAKRARERFLASFDPSLCRYILAEGSRVGFVLVRPMADHILLDHLYLHPKRQGQGIGSSVLRDIMTDADLKSMPIRLGALRGSDSNRFYERSGFVKVDEGEWDVYYVRVPCSVMKD